MSRLPELRPRPHLQQAAVWSVCHVPQSAVMTATYEEDDSSQQSASSQQQKTHASAQKRKATEETSGGEMDEQAWKRQRNRHAAKKCRDRKLQEVEELRKKNEELQQENCQVVRQREDLMCRCLALEDQLKRHKEQGCTISDLGPSCSELVDILNPSTPPSPSFAGSYASSSSPCLSSASSPSPLALDSSPVQSFEAGPVVGRYVFRDGGSGQDSGEMHGMMNGQEKRNPTASAPMPVRARPVTATATPQQAPQPALQVTPAPQRFPFHVRDKDGNVRVLQLLREDYIKVMNKLKAVDTASANQQSSFAPVVSAPVPPPVFSSQQISRAVPSEAVFVAGGPSPGLQCPVAADVQSSEPDTVVSSDPDLMSLMDLLGDWGNEQMDNPFGLIDPNDMFIKKEPTDVDYDQTIGALFEDESTGVQPKVADNNPAVDSSTPAFSNQFAGQSTVAGGMISILSAGDHGHYQDQAENADAALIQDSPSDNGMLTITVTDPQTLQVVEQTSSRIGAGSAGKLQTLTDPRRVLQPIVPAQKGQMVSYTVLVQKADSSVSALNLPTQTGFEATDYPQPALDSLSAMKTVKIRPGVLKGSAPGPRASGNSSPQPLYRQVATAPAQPGWDGQGTALTSETYSFPQHDLPIIKPLQTAGLKQAPPGGVPAYWNLKNHHDPQMSQTPAVLMSRSHGLLY
ncbi:hypothetical protein ACOMHN_051624 [Nucella lapillus]